MLQGPLAQVANDALWPEVKVSTAGKAQQPVILAPVCLKHVVCIPRGAWPQVDGTERPRSSGKVELCGASESKVSRSGAGRELVHEAKVAGQAQAKEAVKGPVLALAEGAHRFGGRSEGTHFKSENAAQAFQAFCGIKWSIEDLPSADTA